MELSTVKPATEAASSSGNAPAMVQVPISLAIASEEEHGYDQSRNALGARQQSGGLTWRFSDPFGFVMCEVPAEVAPILLQREGRVDPNQQPDVESGASLEPVMDEIAALRKQHAAAPAPGVATLQTLRELIAHDFPADVCQELPYPHSVQQAIADGDYRFVVHGVRISKSDDVHVPLHQIAPTAYLFINGSTLADNAPPPPQTTLSILQHEIHPHKQALPNQYAAPPNSGQTLSHTGHGRQRSQGDDVYATTLQPRIQVVTDSPQRTPSQQRPQPPSSWLSKARAPPVPAKADSDSDDDDSPPASKPTTPMQQPGSQPGSPMLRYHMSDLNRMNTLTDGSNVVVTVTSVKPADSSPEMLQIGYPRVKRMYSVVELIDSEYGIHYDDLKRPIWISVENASVRDYEVIGKAFNLHPLTIEDCQSHSTREKLEIFSNYLFLVFHSLDDTDHRGDDADKSLGANSTLDGAPVANSIKAENELNSAIDAVYPTTPIRLIVFPHCILSFHHDDLLTVNVVRQRLASMYGNKLESTAWLIHATLDCIVDSLLPLVEATSYEVDALDDLIYVLSGSEHRDLLRRMGLTRRRLLFLRQRLWSKRDILMSLIGKDWQLFLSGVQVPYMRDVYDHVVTMLHKIDAASDLLASLQSTYLANVSIDVSDASNKTNGTMRTLTAVATIVLPLTLIAGIFGMNIRVPWQNGETNDLDSLQPFIVLMAGMVAFTIASCLYFKRYDML